MNDPMKVRRSVARGMTVELQRGWVALPSAWGKKTLLLLEKMLTDLLYIVALAGEREALVLKPVSLRTLVEALVEGMRMASGR